MFRYRVLGGILITPLTIKVFPKRQKVIILHDARTYWFFILSNPERSLFLNSFFSVDKNNKHSVCIHKEFQLKLTLTDLTPYYY